jgi:hypothetical protein
MTAIEILSAVSSVATAVGVAVAAYQLLVVRKQAVTTFEDSLNSQYRVSIERIPLEALLGEQLRADDLHGLLPHFYRYFDLCNEQAFLHKHGRITTKTWKNWEEGIKSNLQRPAFATAWAEIAKRAGDDFSSLRALCPPKSGSPSTNTDA